MPRAAPLTRPSLASSAPTPLKATAVENVRKSNSHQPPVTTIEYTFRCAGPRGNAKVKAFISKAYKWYTEKMESSEDNARYM